MKKSGSKTVFNSAEEAWFRKAFNIDLPHLGTACTILMLGSLNDSYAIQHFLNIARKLPMIRFRLVLDEKTDSSTIFSGAGMVPPNCTVYGAQEDHLPFYQEAHLVLDLSSNSEDSTLSDRNILESMACARPVIVPDYAGRFSIVTDGKEGYHINPDQENRLLGAIRELCSDTKTYFRFAVAAREKALHFSAMQLKG